MKIILIGPPGSGKGTQSKYLTEKYQIPQISIGDILRTECYKSTELGIQIKQKIEQGILIPDNIVIKLLKNRIQKKYCSKGFILDGCPRTVHQAEEMDKKNIFINYIIEFTSTTKVIYERILGRRIHQASGRTYHVQFNPPKIHNLDDVTQETLTKRKDDNYQTIQNRLIEYNKNKNQILQFYQSKILNKEIKYCIINSDKNKKIIYKKIKNFLQQN